MGVEPIVINGVISPMNKCLINKELFFNSEIRWSCNSPMNAIYLKDNFFEGYNYPLTSYKGKTPIAHIQGH